MSTYFKEWRAVGIDLEHGREVREEGNWRGAKAAAREDAAELQGHPLPYDDVFIERRKLSAPRRVGP